MQTARTAGGDELDFSNNERGWRDWLGRNEQTLWGNSGQTSRSCLMADGGVSEHACFETAREWVRTASKGVGTMLKEIRTTTRPCPALAAMPSATREHVADTAPVLRSCEAVSRARRWG